MKIAKRLLATLATMTAILAFGICVSAATAPITVPSAYTGTTVTPVSVPVTFTESDKIADYYAGTVIPVVITEPGYFEYNITASSIGEDVRFELCTDATCTTKIGYISSISAGSLTGSSGIIGVETPGTYYLAAYSYSSSYNQTPYTNSLNVSMSLYTISDKTITNGQTISYYNAAYDSTICFKYVATNNGTVTINYSNIGYGDVCLADASKKIITDEVYVSSGYNSTATFAVKKGQTYYIATDVYDSDEKLTISVTEKMVKEKSGAKKKKAVNIKAKKNIKGLIINGEKKADWYKINLKKSKKVKINLNYEGTGYIKIEAFDKKGKSIGSGTAYKGSNKFTISNTLSKKASKGIYYIKISRYDETTSGAYTLKWK